MSGRAVRSTGTGSSDDLVQPFLIEATGVRGRLVRLGAAADSILAPRHYPEAVARLVAEAVVLVTAVSDALKFEGVCTLQATGNGPVPVLMADVTSDGAVRGYAQFDEHALSRELDRYTREEEGSGASLASQSAVRLLGTGRLAFTVDQGSDTQRYQGIVQLFGLTLADCVQHFLQQSQQLPAQIRVSVGQAQAPGQNAAWRAGALMIQRLPRAGPLIHTGPSEEEWRRSAILLGTATDAELIDPDLSPNTLLFRLFHEDGVRVFEPQPVEARCRCSRDRVARVLASLSDQELDELAKDGELEVVCEFCGQRYGFNRAAVQVSRPGS